MQISAVSVNFHTSRELQKAIKSLLQNADDLLKEIIIVDNSNDPGLENVKNLSEKVRIIKTKHNLGFGKAANIGILKSSSPYILLFNPDTVTLPKTLFHLLREISTSDNIAMISPQLIYPDGTLQPTARRFPSLKYILSGRRSLLTRFFPYNKLSGEFLYLDIMAQEGIHEVEALMAAYILMKKDIFVKVGGFDRRFFLFQEDMDLCRKMKEKGYRIVLDTRVKVIHSHGQARKHATFKSSFMRGKSLYLFITKYSENLLEKLIISILTMLYTAFVSFRYFLDFKETEKFWKNEQVG